VQPKTSFGSQCDVLASAKIFFRRAIAGNKCARWFHLVRQLMDLQISTDFSTGGYARLETYTLWFIHGEIIVLDYMSGHMIYSYVNTFRK
jgi:hypothetical protein